MFEKITPNSFTKTKKAILKKLIKMSKKTGGVYYTVENTEDGIFLYSTRGSTCILEKAKNSDKIVNCYIYR